MKGYLVVFHQPIWKICEPSKLDHEATNFFGCKKKSLSCHHLEGMESHLCPPKVRVVSLLQLSENRNRVQAMLNAFYQEMERVNLSKNTKYMQNDLDFFS